MRAAKLTLVICVVVTYHPARCQYDEAYTKSTVPTPLDDTTESLSDAEHRFDEAVDNDSKTQDEPLDNKENNYTYANDGGPLAEYNKDDYQYDADNEALNNQTQGHNSTKLEPKDADYTYEDISYEQYLARKRLEEETLSRCNLILSVSSGFSEYYNSKNRYQEKDVWFLYGENPRVSCSKYQNMESAKIVMRNDGEQVLIGNVSEHDPVETTMSPDKQKSEFICTNLDTACERSITVHIMHVIDVSPTIRQNEYSMKYSVTYGIPISLSCSSPNSARLAIIKNGTILQAENVNKNTIRKVITDPDYPRSEYVCSNFDTDFNTSAIIEVVPVIHVNSQNKIIFNGKKYFITYGDSIEVFCTAPPDVKLILNGDTVSPEEVNTTTVKLVINDLEVGESNFRCRDSSYIYNYNDIDIIVLLRMEVLSPNIRRFGSKFVVKHGDPYEILCSGPAAGPLAIYKDGEQVSVLTVNETTIKLLVNTSEIHDGFDEYFCASEEERESSHPEAIACGPYMYRHEKEDTKHAKVVVEVTVPPEAAAVGFRCVSHQLKYMNCSWLAPSYGINFTLSQINDGSLIRLCEKKQTLSGPKFCVFDYEIDIKVFTFIMTSCNGFGCYNQTFLIDHLSILKPPPPSSILVRTSSRGVELSWGVTHLEIAGKSVWSDFDFDCDIEFLGIENRRSTKCCVTMHCSFFTALPCPGQFYEVRIYHKPKKAVGEEYWSDSSVSFYTDVDDKADSVNPKCNHGPKKTKEVMAYFAQKLIQEVRQNVPNMKKVVSSLRKKQDKIRAYLNKK